jgi:hypothetical protein
LHVAVQVELLGEPAEVLLSPARVMQARAASATRRASNAARPDVLVHIVDRPLGMAERNVDARFFGDVQELRHRERTSRRRGRACADG